MPDVLVLLLLPGLAFAVILGVEFLFRNKPKDPADPPPPKDPPPES